MIQDEEGRLRMQNCLNQTGREEIKTFCHLVERSRWGNVELLENQLCQTQKKCKWKPSER